MDPSILVAVIAGLVALVSAVVTARNASASTKASAMVTEQASQREFQAAFLNTLSAELEKAQKLNTELRIRLSQAEDNVDAERSRRRDCESKLDQLIETVERLQAILSIVPGLVDDPAIARFLQTDFSP